jgi:adenosylhomocysteine nucleosidase
MIGIIGAMAEEIELFRKNMEIRETRQYAKTEYFAGLINGQEIVLLQSGIGKVKSTISTQILIDRFDIDMIIFTGLAGALAPNLKRGDLIVANQVVQYDFDLTAFGRRPGELPDIGRLLEPEPSLIKFLCYAYDDVFKAQRAAPQLIVGSICSGDKFISDRRDIEWLQREFGAVATEMEGAAVGYACFVNDVRFAILRTISDTGGEGATDDFDAYLKVASENSFKIVSTMLQVMSYRDAAV